MLRIPRPFAPALAVAVTLAAVAIPAPAAPHLRHFELRRSMPAADTALDASPERIQLWFSQEPQTEGARIRLVDGTGELVELGPTAVVPDTATSLRAAVPTVLAPGPYTVHWRAMARDGHVVTGEIPFSIRESASR